MRRSVVALLLAASAAAPAAPVREWQAVLFEGRQIGHVEIVRDTSPSGARVYEETLRLDLRVGGVRERLHIVTAYREDANGAPLQMRRSRRLGGRTTGVQVDVGPERLAIARTRGGDVERSRSPRPHALHFPQALHDAIAAMLARGGGSLQATTLHPDSLRPVALSISVDDAARGMLQVRRDGRRAQALAWPFDLAQLDPPLRLLGVALQRERCPRACTQVDDATFDPLATMLVRSPYRLPGGALRGRIRYVLQERGHALAGLPAGSEQQVDIRGDRTVVTVCAHCDTAEPAPADGFAHLLRTDDPWIDAAHPRIRMLARSARARRGTVEQRMRRLAAAVRAHMDGPTDFTGYLKASDAVRERGGDCTEFALVLAAVGRAHGIPTRIVSGLAYASRFTAERDVFSPHMWVQAWTGTRWQSFDAALERYDAGHIALAVGTGEPAAHAQTMQRLRTLTVIAAGQLPAE